MEPRHCPSPLFRVSLSGMDPFNYWPHHSLQTVIDTALGSAPRDADRSGPRAVCTSDKVEDKDYRVSSSLELTYSESSTAGI